jgi:hypothetical protein
MPYYYYGFDPTYVLVLIGAVICLGFISVPVSVLLGIIK